MFEGVQRGSGKEVREVSKHREDGIAKETRNMLNGSSMMLWVSLGRTTMFYVVEDSSKHREEGIAKKCRNMLSGWPAMSKHNEEDILCGLFKWNFFHRCTLDVNLLEFCTCISINTLKNLKDNHSNI